MGHYIGAIIFHILDGMKKYRIDSFNAWVWRIAHNRYARFINARNRERAVLAEDGYRLNFACFTERQFAEFTALFDMEDEQLDGLLTEWIAGVRKSFGRFVPARLGDQINQWVSCYLFQIVGHVTEELIRRGALRRPDPDKPLTDGIVCVAGRYVE